MFFASFHFFIFFILRITINCNYLFTKHFKYKTLIYLCQRPPPEKFVVFYLYKRWVGGGMVIRCCRYFLGCGGICMVGIFDIADAFFDAVVSARVGYSLLRMLFPCHSCIIASAIYLFHDLQIFTST